MGCGGSKNTVSPLKNTFDNDYELIEKVGAGNSWTCLGTAAEIWKAKKNSDGEIYAVKIIKKSLQSDESVARQMFYDEKDTLCILDSPNVVKYHDCYENESQYYLVTEFLNGKNLMDFLGTTSREKLNEHIIAGYLLQILTGISHCHSKKVIHRDIKPSNLVFADDKGEVIKLIDFNFAKAFDTDSVKALDIYGSPGYTAPEVITKNAYVDKSDIWSIGILAWYIFSGNLPYNLGGYANLSDLLETIKGASFTEESFIGPMWEKVSSDAKKFILKMLDQDPEKRLSADELLKEEWLTNTNEDPLDLIEIPEDSSSDKPSMNYVTSSIIL